MNLNDIKNWMQNPERDYKTGLAIYNEYKNSNKFDNFFRSVESPPTSSMQFKMLVFRVGEILRKLGQNPKLVKPDPISVKPINIDELKKKSGDRINSMDALRPRIVDNPLIEASKLPQELQKLYFENKSLTKEIGQLHQELKAIPKFEKFNGKRKDQVAKIIARDDKRASNWSKIDTWWQQNKLVTEEQKQEFDAKKEELKVSLQEAKVIFNRIDTLKINITREEKRSASNSVLKEKLTPKIEEWKTELAVLEAKVK